jgi:hypothetical protein
MPVEFSHIPFEYIENARKTLEIVSQNPTRFLYQIDFPERFIPSNGMQYFWKLVRDLMKKGVVFEIKTSCVFSVGWIDRTYTDKDGVTHIGWDNQLIKFINEPEQVLDRNYYGSDISQLFLLLQF